MDLRWQIANEARSGELAIIFSYPTSASGIIRELKNHDDDFVNDDRK